MECLVFATVQLLECTFASIARQIGYMIHYRSNRANLLEEVQVLEHLKESLVHRVKAALRNGEEIESEILSWLDDVDEILEMAKHFLEDGRVARTRCSCTSFPNLCLRSRFGRRCIRILEEIARLQQHRVFDRISYIASTSPEQVSLPYGDKDFNSRVSTLEDILVSLEDPNVNMIGVCGLGGVGKTTLVKQVVMKARENDSFDEVVWVDVSSTSDLKRIQIEIAKSFGLRFEEEESVPNRASHLYDRLMYEKSVLIILDDLWEKLELQKIGIPVPEQKSIKILMTSRSREVLSHKMEAQKIFLLSALPENEAWSLFKEKAGLGSTTSPQLLSIATEVAAECFGLPIAIVTVASALKDKSLTEWEDMLRRLRDSSLTNVTGTSDPIIESKEDDEEEKDDITEEVKKSLKRLEKDAESIFYLCGLLMGDNLAKSDLFRYSVGLGLFENIDKMKDVRNIFDTCISKLEDLQLLQSNPGEFLTMNNVVRNVAISLESKHQRHFIRRHEKRKESLDIDKLKDCRMIILSDHDINEHKEGLNCQNLKFFQILKTDSSSKLPDNFLKGMRRLKVLNLHDNFFKEMPALKVLDLTAVKFSNGRLPSSIAELKMLTTLCLDYCVLERIADIAKLTNLKVLSLSNSNVKKLPHELGLLTQLQFLDLSYCFQLEVIPPDVLSSLKKLEGLYMLGSFDDWDVNNPKKQKQSKASLVELTNLSCLTTLEVTIPDERMLPGPDDINLLFGRLKWGKVLIGRQLEFHQFFEHETSAALKLWLSCTVTENVERLLTCVDHLGIGSLEGAKNIVPRLNGTAFPRLKCLYVGYNEMQWIADPSGNNSDIDLFPNLDSLVLLSVMNLERLCSSPLMGQSFSRLKFITVRNCNKLKSVLSFSTGRGLPHLLQIDLKSCDSMKGIVFDEGDATIGALTFPELRYLYLKNLPELVGFRCEDITGNNPNTPLSLFCDKVMSQNLEILDIEWTKGLKTIWQCSRLLSNCFGKLKKIDISFCADLKSIFPYQIVSTIPCLETLTVAHCESLQEIITTEDNPPSSRPSSSKEVDDEEEIFFAKLKLLELDDLSSLRSFCSMTNTYQFPSLNNLVISNCPRMKIFCIGVLMIPAGLKSVKKDGEMQSIDLLNTTIRRFK